MTQKFHQRTSRTSTGDKQLQQNGWFKINSNKPVAFLYSKDKHAEKEIREKIPFTLVTNNMKYLGDSN